MATRTTYYNLIKPSQTDLVDVRDLNTNFDNIDAIMHTNEANIDALDGRITTAESDIEGLEEKTTHLGAGTTYYDFAPQIELTEQLGINAENVKVKITAQQNLHGYSKPWAGGAGKNKLPMTVAGIKAANTNGTWSGNAYTYRGITYTLQTDNDGNVIGIKCTGTASLESVFRVSVENLSTLTDNTYIANGCPSGGSASTYRMRGSNGLFGDLGSGATFSKTSSTSSNVEIVISESYSIASGGIVYYPMIRLATESDPTFEPYENSCLIEGFDECEISRFGKNLFNPSVDSIESIDITGTGNIRYGHIFDSGDYTISLKDLGSDLYYYRVPTKDLSDRGTSTPLNNSSSVNVTVDSNHMLWVFTTDPAFPNADKLAVMVGTNESYEPYLGRTYTINLGGTIYGGTLDVTSGKMVMVVDRASVDLGSLDWVSVTQDRFASASLRSLAKKPESLYTAFNGISSIYVAASNNDVYSHASDNIMSINDNGDVMIYSSVYAVYTAEQFKAAMSGVQLVYELAEPFTVQLTTTQQIQLLDGYNLIQANTGDIAVTTGDIESAIVQADSLIEANTQAIREIDSFNASIFGTVETGTTASQAYAQGDYFVKDNKMAKALTSIAQGATFTLNTNYAAYTLADILKAIENL